MEFDGLEIPQENMLLGEGDGLKMTQIRLGPARLTHCMRWTGWRGVPWRSPPSRFRAPCFGARLREHEGVQWLLGEAAMQVDIGRLLTMRAAC